MRAIYRGFFESHTRAFVVIFLASVTVYVSLRYALVISDGGHYWATGDWLINYRAGFVRRGLSGAITLALSDLTGIHAHLVAAALQTSIYVVMMGLVLAVFAPVQWTAPVLMLIVSPVFLLMPFYYLKLAMSKETVGFLAVAALAAWHPIRSRGLFWFGLALFAAAGFVHELNAFMAPAAIALIVLFAWNGALPKGQAALCVALIAVSACSALLLSAIFNGNGLSTAICNEILSRGESELFCIPEGPVMWLERTTADGIAFTWQEQIASGAWPKFLGGYILAMAPFLLFRVAGDTTGRKTTIAFVVAFFGIILLTPLFVVASDWGRWISVHVFGLTLVTITALRFGLIVPRITSTNPLFALYGLTWSMPDFNGADFTFGLLGKLARLVERLAGTIPI